MDAAVAESPDPAIGYAGRSVESRVSSLEGTITAHDRIFDMLQEGQQNLRADIAGLRDETHTSIGGLRDDMDKRFGEMDKRFGEVDKRFGEVDKRFGEADARIATMEVRLNTKIDSNLKWILGVQIAMWVTIIAAVIL